MVLRQFEIAHFDVRQALVDVSESHWQNSKNRIESREEFYRSDELVNGDFLTSFASFIFDAGVLEERRIQTKVSLRTAMLERRRDLLGRSAERLNRVHRVAILFVKNEFQIGFRFVGPLLVGTADLFGQRYADEVETNVELLPFRHSR